MTVGKVKDFNFSSGGMTKGFAMGGSSNCYAKGGKVMEKSTGESYPSRRAMEKHESMETPRMQRKEVIQRETVKAPAAPQGMLKNRGALGVIANKNPGETAMHTAPRLPGKMMLKKGGEVKKPYAMGGVAKHVKPMKSTSTEDKMMGKSPENYSSVTGAGGGSKPIDMYEMAMYKKGGKVMPKNSVAALSQARRADKKAK